MIGDDFEVSVQNTEEGEKHLAVYVKETETGCEVLTVFDTGRAEDSLFYG